MGLGVGGTWVGVGVAKGVVGGVHERLEKRRRGGRVDGERGEARLAEKKKIMMMDSAGGKTRNCEGGSWNSR